MIRVLLVDDEALVRAGIRLVLRHAEDIEVVAEAGDDASAVAEAGRVPVDVVLLDVRMPGAGGLSAVRRIKELRPAAAVLMLTTFGTEEYVAGAVAAGADGFLLKSSRPEELIGAARAAASREAVLSPGVTGHVLRRLRAAQEQERGAAAARAAELVAGLTEREREVLALLGDGSSNAQIAERLGVEPGTVKAHVGRILTKLGATNRVRAALVAHEAGLTGGL
ncbi:DNA-binding response regulator [Streptomyces spiroverticillatus]|uniref:DNA-binding response regulator n=1 Tax=Streptomyces finlayi TaxID=67296 RepID=A0A918X496_9ACTN|nr:response regulator transcription factor [Streptomyces finlayi]GHA27763.1 DNA-binding response regulator [Streptomyces spiroverticillatus]GHD08795.1 DNA-binding response regulator [Streptomyces finlayi]